MAKFYATNPPRFKDVPKVVRNVLARLPDSYHVCLEFPAQRDFDVVLVHHRGIHNVEVKNERRTIVGGPQVPNWTIQDNAGRNIPPGYSNPYNQAVDCANKLRDFLRLKSASILTSPCSPGQCSTALCATHGAFWYAVRVFPYVCIPEWNPGNKIAPDSTGWCWLVQADSNVQQPQYLLKAILQRDWSNHSQSRNLSLGSDEIVRTIKELGLVEVSEDVALQRATRWRPSLPDDRVEQSLREREIGTVKESLAASPILTIVGEPKTGKTSLAKLVAMDLEWEGARILEHDFRLEPSALMIERFLSRVGTPLQVGIQDNVDELLAVLESEKACLILDNFESALDENLVVAEKALSRFLDATLAMRTQMRANVIVTSRFSFRTESGSRLPEYLLGGIDQAAGVGFLQRRYGWTSEQAERLHGIRRGNPHAMYVCAEEAREAMALGVGFDEAVARATVRVGEWAYEEQWSRLTDHERRVLAVVALHPKGMDIQGVEWVAARLGVPGPAMDVVIRLHKKGAVSIVGGRWVQMLPEDQPFVYERTVERKRSHAIACEYYQNALRMLRDEAHVQEDDEEGCEYLLHHAIGAEDSGAAWRVLFQAGVARQLEESGKYDSLSYACRRVRECAGFEDLESRQRAQVCLSEGSALRWLGDVVAGEILLREAEELFLQAADVVGQACALSELGLAIRKTGGFGQREIDHYEMALALVEGREDAEAIRVRSLVRGRLGRALELSGGAPEEILRHHQEAVRLAREIGDERLLSPRLGMLGGAYRELKRDFGSARKCFEESLAIAERLQSESHVVAALAGLAKTQEKARKWESARVLYLEAYERTRSIDAFGMLDRLGTLGHIHKSLSRYEEAEAYYQRALDLARRLKNAKAEAENLDELGSVYRTMSHTERDEARRAVLLQQALECHQTAVEIQDRFEVDEAGRANRYQELGRTYLGLGEYAKAKRLFVKAVRHASKSGRRHLEGWQYRSLGDSYERLGENRSAGLCYWQAIELFEEHQLRHEAKDARKRLERAFGRMTFEERRNVEGERVRLREAIAELLRREEEEIP